MQSSERVCDIQELRLQAQKTWWQCRHLTWLLTVWWLSSQATCTDATVNQTWAFSTGLTHLPHWPNELTWCKHLTCCSLKDHCHWWLKRACLLFSSIPRRLSSCLCTEGPGQTLSASYRRAATHIIYLRNTDPGRKTFKLLEGKSEKPQS